MPVIDKIHVKDQNGTEQVLPIGAEAVNVTFNPDATGGSPNSVNTRIQDTVAHMNKKAVTDSVGIHGLRYNTTSNKLQVEVTPGSQSDAGGGGEGDMTKAVYVDANDRIKVSKGGTGNANGYIQIGAASGSTIGTKATAEGEDTTSSGTAAHAEGKFSIAIGNYSHAEGYATNAIGYGAHCEGGYSTATSDLYIKAYGDNSHAEGLATYAVGKQSHAEGFKTSAIGVDSHAEGYQTCTENDYAHAEGYSTYAGGVSSHAEGENTTACGSESHAEGSNTYAQGTGSHAEGLDTYAGKVGAYGGGAHAEGIMTTAYSKGAHAEGYKSYAKGNGAHTEGGYTTISNSGGTFAIGDNSHAEGYGTTAYGIGSHAEGRGLLNMGIAYGDYSHSEGLQTVARGNQSHAEGDSSGAMAAAAHAEGEGTAATAASAHAEGSSTEANNFASHAGGHLNAAMTTGGSISNQTGTAFVIGNGIRNDSSTTASNAFVVNYDGTAFLNGSQLHPGSDYAEFFEQNDSNTNNEDRVGYFVTFDNGKKIRKAFSKDNYILGIISGSPNIIGNGDCYTQTHKEMRDEFNRIQYEPAPLYEKNEETGEYEQVLDDEGNLIYQGIRPIFNPEYDPSQLYISRRERPEWAAVGMLGVLPVRDDGTCEINGYCTVADGGIATKADENSINKYRVIGRKTENVVEVVFR